MQLLLRTVQVTELWQFFLVRMLTGIAVGGCFPLVFSLLGDLAPISARSAMAAVVQLAVGAGIGGGQVWQGQRQPVVTGHCCCAICSRVLLSEGPRDSSRSLSGRHI
jgi:MFS family permease